MENETLNQMIERLGINIDAKSWEEYLGLPKNVDKLKMIAKIAFINTEIEKFEESIKNLGSENGGLSDKEINTFNLIKKNMADVSQMYYNSGKKLGDEEYFYDGEDSEAENDYELSLSSRAIDFLKKNKNKIITGTVIGTSIVIAIGFGIHHLKKDKNNPNAQATPTPMPTATAEYEGENTNGAIEVANSEGTPKPQVIVDSNEDIIEDNNEENMEKENEVVNCINADNIDEITRQIEKENQEKGLNIDIEAIKSALLIANIDNIPENDLKNLMADKNIFEVIQRFYDYSSNVNTHNAKGNPYISFKNLVYDLEDKEMVNALDDLIIEYRTKLENNSLTGEDHRDIFDKITSFIVGNGGIGENNYQIYSSTSGAGLVIEQYGLGYLAIASKSQYLSNEEYTDIITLTDGSENNPAVLNGSRFLGSIVSRINTCQEKTR